MRFYAGTIEVAEFAANILNKLGIEYAIELVDGEVELIVYNN